jgi:uncharacterized protein with von Willebrand factor type A (vWA) domain
VRFATGRSPSSSRARVAEGIVARVVAFGRVLRAAGLEVGPGRLGDAVSGLAAVGVERRDDVYWTLRSTLVSRREELDAFERAFRAWFLRAPVEPVAEAPRLGISLPRERPAVWRPGTVRGAEASMGGWSPDEQLRRKDFAAMSADEFARVRPLIAGIAASRPRRRSRRLRPHPRGRELDLRRLARRSLATGGDPFDRPFRRRTEVPRRLVLLCDVSGSMEAYARALLLYLHAAVGTGPGVEAFAFGTRLTRLTKELAHRDPDDALRAAAARITDRSAGTRIGTSLRAFNAEWGRRGLSRGAIVVVLSDGWEREDPDLVAREIARLARAAYALVWVNPLKGSPGYEPLAGGMRAALPFVDRFLPGHDLESFEALAGVIEGIRRRRAS